MAIRIADDFEAIREALQQRQMQPDTAPQVQWKDKSASFPLNFETLSRMTLIEDETGRQFRLRVMPGGTALWEIEMDCLPP